MRSFRPERVANVIREVVSEVLQRRLQDPRLEPLTTVTRVEVSGDLLIARVYFSVYGGDVAERRTMAAIRHAGGFIQRCVASELSLRQCPELRFELDEAAKKARKTLEIIDENRRLRPDLYPPEVEAGEGGDPVHEAEIPDGQEVAPGVEDNTGDPDEDARE